MYIHGNAYNLYPMFGESAMSYFEDSFNADLWHRPDYQELCQKRLTRSEFLAEEDRIKKLMFKEAEERYERLRDK